MNFISFIDAKRDLRYRIFSHKTPPLRWVVVRPGSVVTTPRRAVSLWAQHCAHVYFSLRQLGKSFSRASNSNSLMVFPSFAAKILSWRCSSSVTGKFTCFLCIQPPFPELLTTQQRSVKKNFHAS